jgi:predicted DNA-binding transcriptional regulator YafY
LNEGITISRRADRLLQIVQILRRRDKPTTAAALAEELEVVPRTVYRDIAALQASRIPVEGAAGIGYVLRPGYDLPPLMFSNAEMEAAALGLRMVTERGDPELAQSAADALGKIRAVVPKEIADSIWKTALLVPHGLEPEVSFGEHVPSIRAAIRDTRKARIVYADARSRISERVVWPLGMYLYSHVSLVCAWCEHRQAFRAFRTDRITSWALLDDRFDGKGGGLLKAFLADFKASKATDPERPDAWIGKKSVRTIVGKVS